MSDQSYEKLTGKISSVIYRNEDNGYTVLRLDTEDGKHEIVVGCIPLAAPGESITAWGLRKHHPTHGSQFQAEITERAMPSDAGSIYAYLSSHIIKGIGPATASMIVSRFGEDALNVLRDHPEKLATIQGIGMNRAQEMSASFRQQTGMRMLMEYLKAAKIRPVIAVRMYRTYGDEAMMVLEEDPYVLADPQIGASFAEADALALSQGMEGDSPERIAAAIRFELRYNTGNGHCFLPVDKLYAVTAQLLDLEMEQVAEVVDMLAEEQSLVVEPVSNVTACYLTEMYNAEVFVADRIRDMAGTTYDAPHVSVERVIEKIEGEERIEFAPKQKKILDSVLTKQLVVITGGPGTGKTMSVRAVLALYDALGLDTMLAAPTGQASKRLAQVTGRQASTIHRMLGASFSAETDSVEFRKNAKDPLRCDALILDECSMIDIGLMQAVLAGIRPSCRLVLVGDADQLPSVGPGCVFQDIIRSGIAETIRLTEIFRQKEESRIVVAAHEINHGKVPDLKKNTAGFYFMRRRDPEAAAETIVSLCLERLPKNMGIPSSEIQVLSPTRKGPVGTVALNQRLQAVLNPPGEGKKEMDYAGHIYREGDRVVQIRNDYDILWKTEQMEEGHGIFNGDIGHIVQIDPAAQTMTVDFDGHRADLLFEQAAELEHAWAMTVHKSQGSEYRGVVLALVQTPTPLMYRALLYTGVTRAAELLVAVGDDMVIQSMTENSRRAKRYSGLRFRLI